MSRPFRPVLSATRFRDRSQRTSTSLAIFLPAFLTLSLPLCLAIFLTFVWSRAIRDTFGNRRHDFLIRDAQRNIVLHARNPNEAWIFHYVLLRSRRSNICWNITSSDLNANDNYGNNRWSRFRPIHRSRILTLEILFPSSYRTSFSSFSRCTGSSVKVTVARMERTDGATVAFGAMLSRRAAKLEARVENSRPGPSVRGTGRKTRRTRGEEYCILGGLCFRGERKSAYE